MNNKSFKTYEEQIELLKSRNLIFRDPENAKYILMNNSYYSLINGYKDLFTVLKNNPNEEDDYDNNDFDDLRRLYDFDKEISSVLYKYLLKIEDTLKTNMSYSVANEYGHLELDYLKVNNYDLGKKLNNGKYSRDETLATLRYKIASKDSKTINHYKLKYKNVPPWIVVNSLTLGNIIHWYSISNPNIKGHIANTFLNEKNTIEDNKKMFLLSIWNIRLFRNKVAHGTRIYYNDSLYSPPVILLSKYVSSDFLKDVRYYKHIRKSGFVGICISMCILFSKRDTVRKKFINDLEEVFDTYKTYKPEMYYTMLKFADIPFNFIDSLRKIF